MKPMKQLTLGIFRLCIEAEENETPNYVIKTNFQMMPDSADSFLHCSGINCKLHFCRSDDGDESGGGSGGRKPARRLRGKKDGGGEQQAASAAGQAGQAAAGEGDNLLENKRISRYAASAALVPLVQILCAFPASSVPPI